MSTPAPPSPGPCAAWITGDDIDSCCTIPDGFDLALLDLFALEASQVLYQLSGCQFSGACEETVRPCAPGGCAGWLALGAGIIPGWGSGGETWGGGISGGGIPFAGWGWYDVGAGYGTNAICGCQALDQIQLGYPVVEVLEVKISGVVVDPTSYRVDEWRWLVRTADTSTDPPTSRFWPSCQDLQVGDDDPGAFAVTYTHGIAPPMAGELAAAQLACQFVQQCAGGDCILPVGTTKVIRQGVQIERGILANWLVSEQGRRGWATGLVHVDAFLNAYNPNGLLRRPRVFTPDLPQMPRRTGT